MRRLIVIVLAIAGIGPLIYLILVMPTIWLFTGTVLTPPHLQGAGGIIPGIFAAGFLAGFTLIILDWMNTNKEKKNG